MRKFHFIWKFTCFWWFIKFLVQERYEVSILSLTIFVGMTEFGEDLEELTLFNYQCYWAEDIVFIFIITFNELNTLNTLLNFSSALKIGSSVLPVLTKWFWFCGMFKFCTISAKKLSSFLDIPSLSEMASFFQP